MAASVQKHIYIYIYIYIYIQIHNSLQTRFLVREDALKAERRNCPTKEEQNKLWSRVPKRGPIPRLTGRLTCRPQEELQLQCPEW
jgi:hypothetical protein